MHVPSRPGDARTITQLRADAFTDLLAGTPFQLTPSVDPLSAEADTEHPHNNEDGPSRGSRAGGGPGRGGLVGGGPSGAPQPEPPDHERLIDVYEYERASSEDREWADRTENPGWWPTCTPTRPGGTSVNSCFENGNSDWVLPGDRCACCGGVLPEQRPGAVQISVKLSTLIGRDDHPALIPGLGPVVAEIARQIALDPLLCPAWRYSVFDPHGDLLHHGTTTRRPSPARRADSRLQTRKTEKPCTCPRVQPGNRQSAVELQLTMAAPAAAHDPGWQAVIADIAAQVSVDQHANPPSKWSEVDDRDRLRDHGRTSRHPNAEEAAFIRARDHQRQGHPPHHRRRGGGLVVTRSERGRRPAGRGSPPPPAWAGR